MAAPRPRLLFVVVLVGLAASFAFVAHRDRDARRHAREVSASLVIRFDEEPLATFEDGRIPSGLAFAADGEQFAFVDPDGTFARAVHGGALERRGPTGELFGWLGDELLVGVSEARGVSLLRDGRAETFLPNARAVVSTLGLRRVVYVTAGGVFMRAATSARSTRLYSLGRGERLAALAVSPDGRHLAFLRQRGERDQPALMVLPLEAGRAPREVLTHPGLSMRTTRLAFVARDRVVLGLRTDTGNRPGDPVVAQVAFDPESGRWLRGPEPLTCPRRACRLVGGSADGRRLLVEAFDPDIDAFTRRIEDDALLDEQHVAGGPGPQIPAGRSPAGALEVHGAEDIDVACRAGRGCVRSTLVEDEVLHVSVDGEPARGARLVLPEGTRKHRVDLTPDGRAVVFSRTAREASLSFVSWRGAGPAEVERAPLPTWMCDPTDLAVLDDTSVLLACRDVGAGSSTAARSHWLRWSPHRDEHGILSGRSRAIHGLVALPERGVVAYGRERHPLHLYLLRVQRAATAR